MLDLTPYAADIPAAYSTARSLYNSPLAVNLLLQNSNSASLNSITCTGAGLTEADLASLRDGVGQLRVRTVFNQSSIGSKWADFVQATAGTQMVFEEADGTTQYKINGNFAQKNDNTRYLALSGGTTKTMGASWACVAVVQYTGAYASSRAILGGSKAGVGHTWFGQHNTNSRWYYRDLTAAVADNQASMTGYDNGQVNATWDKFSGRPLVICVRVKDGLQELYLNGWLAASDTAANPVGLNVLEWGRAALGGTLFEGYMAEAVFFENADSAGVFAYIGNALDFFNAKPLVILAGDSHFTGFKGTGVPLQIVGQVLNDTDTFPVFLVATVGHRLDEIATALASVNTSFFTRYTGALKKNICVCGGGTNDRIQGANAATRQARYDALWAQQKAAGAYVVAETPLGCTTTGSSTQTMLTEDYTYITSQVGSGKFDALVDLYSDSRIGFGRHADTTYFDADGIHLNSTGQAVHAALIKAEADASIL